MKRVAQLGVIKQGRIKIIEYVNEIISSFLCFGYKLENTFSID